MPDDLAAAMIAALRRFAWRPGSGPYRDGSAWACLECGCYSHIKANEHHADWCSLADLIRRADAATRTP